MAAQNSLFGDAQADLRKPLAARMRPRTLDEILGQDHLLAPGRALRRALEADRVPSMVLWGPPGSGKTHLLEGIWRQARAAKTLRSVIYLSAEQFTNQFIDAIRSTGAPNFRRKIREVELLLIDV